jgi:hypothetical protein
MQKMTIKEIVWSVLFCAVGWGVLQVLIYFIGELHALTSMVTFFIVLTSSLLMRIARLERELMGAHRAADDRNACRAAPAA